MEKVEVEVDSSEFETEIDDTNLTISQNPCISKSGYKPQGRLQKEYQGKKKCSRFVNKSYRCQ